MQTYNNLTGHSGIMAYEAGPDYIIVKFASPGRHYYRYTYSSAGPQRIEIMKSLAASGQGLATYISRHVKQRFESSWS